MIPCSRLVFVVFIGAVASLTAQSRESLPLAFEPVAAPGQGFVARGAGYGVAIDPRGVELILAPHGADPSRLVLQVEGAAPLAGVGEDLLPGVSHYLKGSPANWRTHVSQFGKVRCANVLPGVELVLYGNGRALEYDFIVAPGVDPRVLRVCVGSGHLSLAGDGQLTIHMADDRAITQARPVAYQTIEGERRSVDVDYVLLSEHTFGFRVGESDPSAELVIDPVLVYASYLGGNGVDRVHDIVVDASGDAYLTGYTAALDFPVSGTAYDRVLTGLFDAFVTKVSSDGSTVLWSTYLGGSGQFNTMADSGVAIGVDAQGRAVVLGHTDAVDFPVVNAFQPVLGGNFDAFVAMIAPDGSSLVWSTFLGGAGYEITFRGLPTTPYGGDLAVLPDGTTYVVGHTTSADFPVRNARQSTRRGNDDAFLTRFDGTGTVVFSTYLGGSSYDFGRRIVIDSAGNPIVSGDTLSTDYPVSPGAWRDTGGSFVTKLDPNGQTILWSTRFVAPPLGMAVDPAGAVYLAGTTRDRWFPVTPGAWQTAYSGANDQSRHGDGWIAKLDATAATLEWCTLLGTYDVPDTITDIRVDALGHVYAMFNGTAVTNGPARGAKVVKLNSEGSGVAYEFRVAGRSGAGLALDVSAFGSVWAAGFSTEDQVPTTAGSFQPGFVGPSHIGDGWVARVADSLAGVSTVKLGAPRVARGDATTGAVTIDGRAPAGGFVVTLTATPGGVLSIPSRVTVPAGSSTASFAVGTDPDTPRVDVTVRATAGATSAATAVTVWPGPTYRLTDLGPLGAIDARGINNSGRAAGRAAPGPGYVHDDLSGLVSVGAALADINESGQACGSSGSSAVLFTPGQGLTTLPPFAGAGGAQAEGLNDLAQVVGWAALTGSGNARAFRYTAGVGMVDLGTLPGGPASMAFGINNDGDVVGESFVNNGVARRAFVFRDGVGMIDLGTLPGHAHSVAHAINDAGEIVGISADQGFQVRQAVRWRNGVISDLGTLPGDSRSFAYGINAHGHAVGISAGSGATGQHAVLYTDRDGLQDLGDLLDPDQARQFDLATAWAIDDVGRLVGSGTSGEIEATAAFRLDPINARPYGRSCPGTGGAAPSLAAEGLPVRGATFGLRVAGGRPGSGCALLFGTAAASLSVGGCELLVGGSMLPALAFAFDADGRLDLPVGLRADLPQATIYAQAILLDPGSANGLFTTTNGLAISLR